MEILQIGNCLLINGDCYEYIKTIPDKSIDLIHTDPPYVIHSNKEDVGPFMEKKGFDKSVDKLKNISDGYNVDFMFEQFERITKNINYQIWCNKKQFIDYLLLAKENKWTWQDICLYRNNAMPNVNGKYQDKDYLVHLWKGRKLTGCYKEKITDYHWNIGGKKEYNHPALKPLEPIINLIQTGSDENDVVFDPFMGSGTTGVACVKTNRVFIGIEIDKTYFEIAKERIENELK